MLDLMLCGLRGLCVRRWSVPLQWVRATITGDDSEEPGQQALRRSPTSVVVAICGSRIPNPESRVTSRVHRPLSSPVGDPANSGCTLTTPYCRSSRSRLAAIIHRKLIEPPGAATFG